jgi:adenylosuccinate synthase
MRAKTYAFCGGVFGDEGKGRIVDMVVDKLAKTGPVAVYRDNGGANAGHTVKFGTTSVAFHQLPSAIFVKKATVVLGKEMVIHPGDLIAELQNVEQLATEKQRAKILIDEMAFLSLDTHRAYENVLKQWQSGGKGATGRGISPAYADVLLRHPLRMRDLLQFNQEKIELHYRMYAALIQGLGQKLENCVVQSLHGEKKVGSKAQFLKELKKQSLMLKPYIADVHSWLEEKWADQKWGFVFEKAQAVGLDYRWGLYPDVTASDTTFQGIWSATEGIIDPFDIEKLAGVIKATYMSSVGTRRLPTAMTGALADRIREDANEYGATTKRPRDLAFLDLPALRFFCKVGRLNSLVITHMDTCYPKQPVKVCIDYQKKGKKVSYRPDQEFLDTVKPIYQEFQSWDLEKLRQAKSFKELPKEAKIYLNFLKKELQLPIFLITTGAKREQGFFL